MDPTTLDYSKQEPNFGSSFLEGVAGHFRMFRNSYYLQEAAAALQGSIAAHWTLKKVNNEKRRGRQEEHRVRPVARRGRLNAWLPFLADF